jgi:hypothetical protein
MVSDINQYMCASIFVCYLATNIPSMKIARVVVCEDRKIQKGIFMKGVMTFSNNTWTKKMHQKKHHNMAKLKQQPSEEEMRATQPMVRCDKFLTNNVYIM